MPLVYQQNINEHTRLAIWEINELEDFFLNEVSVQREIKHPHKRLQHLAGRLLLKRLFPDFPNEMIKIADTRKPYLENESFHFSISHCGDHAAAIVSTQNRVGIDIELFSSKAVTVKNKFLGDDEWEIINKNANSVILEIRYCTLLWSIKETLFKWAGKGELDFKKHLHIHSIEADKASCSISKDNRIEIPIPFTFFEDFVLTYAVTK